MDFGWGKLTHYFSQEARAERAAQKERFEQAAEALEPWLEYRVATSLSVAGAYMRATRGGAGAVARELAPGVLKDIISEMRQSGESKSAATDRVVSLILADKSKFTGGGSLISLVESNAEALKQPSSRPAPA